MVGGAEEEGRACSMVGGVLRGKRVRWAVVAKERWSGPRDSWSDQKGRGDSSVGAKGRDGKTA